MAIQGSPRPRRSALYVPGSNARALEKARTVPADVLIFDLEDSVPEAAKEAAREAVADAVSSLSLGRREIVVRVNDLDSPWVARDIAAMVAVGPQAILVPKISRTDDIRRARAAMVAAQAPKSIDLWAMIETPAAILNAAAIAAIAAIPAPQLTTFVVGTNDLIAAMGIPPRLGRASVVQHLSNVLLAARAHGLAILDGTFNDIDDRRALRVEARQGHEMGLDGKTVIHPLQVPVVNEAFSPDEEEIAWARRIVDAFSLPGNAGIEVMALAGRMVERLHERSARRTLQMADAIASLEQSYGANERPKTPRVQIPPMRKAT